jgi:hypothetical protein
LDNSTRVGGKCISDDELVRIGKKNLRKSSSINSEYRFEEEKWEGVEMLEKLIIMSDNISNIT